jgi:hypothetical protein
MRTLQKHCSTRSSNVMHQYTKLQLRYEGYALLLQLLHSALVIVDVKLTLVHQRAP